MTELDGSTPIRLEMPEDYYDDTLHLFQQDGTQFEDAIEKDPRLAYEVFRLHYGDILHTRTTKLVLVSSAGRSTTDKEEDGKQAFDAIAKDTFKNIIPVAGEEEREVIIRVMKNPSIIEILRNKYKEPKLKLELRFTIPPLTEC